MLPNLCVSACMPLWWSVKLFTWYHTCFSDTQGARMALCTITSASVARAEPQRARAGGDTVGRAALVMALPITAITALRR